MSNLLVLENEKKFLLTGLASMFYEFTLDTISQIEEDLEVYLKNYTLQSLRRNSRAFLALDTSEDNMFFLDDNANFYELYFSDDLNNPELLLIMLSVRGIERKYVLEDYSFSLKSSYGKYLSFNLSFPRKLKIKKHDTGELFKIVFETGYTWFYDGIIKFANEQEKRLGYELYKFSETIIHSKEFLNNLWFGAITGGFGFRLLNDVVTRESFQLIHKNSKKFQKSTNALVSELLKTKLPEVDLLMINAIKEKNSIDANLKNANYNKTDSLYAVTLKSLYGMDKFTVYPVYESDKFCVVALFDTKNRLGLIPVLERHKIELKDICERSIPGIRLLLGRLRKVKKETLSLFWNATDLKPNIFGLGFDLKKIVNYFYRKK
ncbi:MAG: hypothetical protein V4721_06730 [Bacteroidota bacterium]